jgi:hypothetical protein
MDIAAGLAAIKTSFDVIKGVRELLKHDKLDPVEISNKLRELQEQMLDAQVALGDAQEEIRRLRTELAEQLRVREFGIEFQFNEGVYWHRDYPYCPNCWDAERKPIRLDGPYAVPDAPSRSSWICPTHKSKYYLAKRHAWG